MEATAPTVAAPVAAPASAPAPAPTAAPVAALAAEKSVLQPGMNTREAFDAVFAQKKASIEARPVAEEPAEAAPAPEVSQGTEKIEEKLQAQAKPEYPSEVPLDVATRLERTIPPNVRNVLKALVDPASGAPVDTKARKEIADTYYVGRAYRDAGMPLAAIPAYLEVAPTVDVLKQITSEAKVGREMFGDFMAGTLEDTHRFATRLNSDNPEALQRLVTIVTDPGWLEKTVPDSFTSVGQHALRNLYKNAQREATKTGNAELQAAFDIVAEWAGIGPAAAPTEEPAAQEPVQDPVRARLDAYEEQQRTYQQQQFQQFQQGTYEQAATTVMTEVTKAIDHADPDGVFNQATRAKMAEEIGRRIYGTVAGNSSISARYGQLLQSGDGSAQHKAAVAKFLVDQGLGVMSKHAGNVISEYGSMFEHVFNQREQKTERILSRREPVAAGGRPSAPVDEPPKLQGVGAKVAFDAFFAHRLK